MRLRSIKAVIVMAGVLALAVTGCGSSKASASQLRLGYFPNLTHVTPIVGVQKGFYQDALGSDIKLQTSTYNAGPAAVEALLSGSIDAAYVGPNPAINAFTKSNGAIRIVSGATSGGASLVVKPDINSAADLKGKKIADPQLGGTQDVALRWYLKNNGLEVSVNGGGPVTVVSQENSQTLTTFKAGQVDGAWVPEPWASRLVSEGKGKVLVDERDLWPNKQFATTVLIVRSDFLKDHRDIVKRLVQGHVTSSQFVTQHPDEAQTVVNDGLQKITGSKVAPEVVASAWKQMTFGDDPVGSSFQAVADHAEAVGITKAPKLNGLFDLSILNEVRKTKNLPTVNQP